MKYLLVLMLLISAAYAEEKKEFHLIELNELKLGYKDYIYARDPMFYFSNPKEQINITTNSSIGRFFFLDTLVHGTSDAAQYRRIGLQLQFGLKVIQCLDISYIHHSQHMLESVYPYQKYPVEDSVGVTIYLYRKEKRDTVF